MSALERTRVPPPPNSLLVLVTGITGQQGGQVADHLLQRGHRLRALTRNPQSARAMAFRTKGVELVPGAFDEPASIERAAEGVDAMYLMGTPFQGGVDAEARRGIAAVDAARRAKVPWLVYSSVSDADRHTGIPHFDSKLAVEEHLRASGVPWAVSAPTSFMENLLSPFQLPGLKQGTLASGALPDRLLQQVALEDLGAFVTHLLENPSTFRGRRINVASDALTQLEAARVLSDVSGRRIDYRQVPIEALRAQNADTAMMFEWFARAGYTADIEGLRREYPGVGWHRFRDWATERDWAKLLA